MLATLTVVDAVFPGPDTFDGVTVNVVDRVTVTVCTATLVDAINPLTGGDALQAKAVGTPPLEQDVVRVTVPPPNGNDDGDALIAQLDGGSTEAAATVTVVESSDGPLGVVPRNE